MPAPAIYKDAGSSSNLVQSLVRALNECDSNSLLKCDSTDSLLQELEEREFLNSLIRGLEECVPSKAARFSNDGDSD